MDSASLDDRPSTRQQVAALPYRVGAVVEIMIVSSRETRRWVLPKGWPMKGKTLHAAAAIEALEEAGLEGAISELPAGVYHYHKRRKNGSDLHCSVAVYPLQVTRQRKKWPEKAERTTRWVSVEEAAAVVQEPELQLLILEFGASLRAKGEVHDSAAPFS